MSRRVLRAERRRRSRRRLAVSASIATGVATSVLVATGAAAAAVVLPSAVDRPGATTLREVTAEAEATADAAHAALAGAESITTEIAESGLDLGVESTEVDTTDLREAVERLEDVHIMPILPIPDVVDDTAEHTESVNARVAELRTRLDEAKAQKAAEEAAAAAAAQAQAEAEAAAAALAAGNTVEGAKATASHLAATQYGWGSDQFQCLDSLWQKESDWNYQAVNPSSGATGIPQSLPGHKMAAAGPDWQTNATTQIRWGLDYIARAYGTPCAAWAHSQATDWY
ncbi:phospholipase [Microbacterium sp. zg-YB36]|uniref:aggregation-promoting factor C-terminal-like domain-containing protein n=1 Tax=Microbacterium sp. zg-YB36 TaxID=2969407 RepID=UPI00214B4A5A|nr:phospholipase [Microbacterium sp. zg-YB36]MDL5351532.1 phospholipase [Microbacterium sp. zg-YB36]